MVDAEILAYYEHGGERDRLSAGGRQVEFLRIRDLLARHLPPAPATVLDIGGGAGVYAVPLADDGYEVHLVDPVPLHVEQARATARLASASVGDARALAAATGSVDAALLLGPLYHLTGRDDRVTALGEARRVVRPGGVVVAFALSRFYPVFEEIARATEPGDPAETARFVADGQYRNPGGDPAGFTTAYFHRPEEFVAEIEEAGLDVRALVGASGVVKLFPGFARRMEEPGQRERILAVLRLVEAEPSVLGMSQNFVAVAQKGVKTA